MNARQAAVQIEKALARQFGGCSMTDYVAAQRVLDMLPVTAKQEAIKSVVNGQNPHCTAELMVEAAYGSPDWHRTDWHI